MRKRLVRLLNRFRLAKLEKTVKTREELRRQYVFAEGRNERVVFWMERVAREMPLMFKNGKAVDHHAALKKLYYTYDIAGINYYIKAMSRVMKRKP